MGNSDSMKNDSQIQRKRRILLIILCMSCIFGLCWSIFQCVNRFPDPILSIGIVVVCYFIFYGFNICVVYRYSTLGLRIFAWIRVVLVVFYGFVLVFVAVIKLLQVANVASHSNKYDTIRKNLLSQETSLIFGAFIVGLMSFIIDAIVIVFHFKLARLIDDFQNASVEKS